MSMNSIRELQMRPERRSQLLLGVTRSKAKMYEYAVPAQYHIEIIQDPAKLFPISIGLLGDLAARSSHHDAQPEILAELRKSLRFSAHFFDAYIQSRLDEALDPYVIILGAASYYLSELPGSSNVLACRLGEDYPDIEAGGLDDLLAWLLQGDVSMFFIESEGIFGPYIDSISEVMVDFFANGSGEDSLINLCEKMTTVAYASGTPRQLLFADVISAVVRKKIENSTWIAIPLYSDLPRETWREVLHNNSFVKELWPAQHLLGKAGVLKGRSAIVQMPTSAGKTKATEIIIRSAFLAKRATLAAIIAPFRALCHEIKDSLALAFEGEPTKVDVLTDAFQTDFDIADMLGHNQILVVTPEKLLYVLRHAPDLASKIGLAIFDEGHQFDSGKRGITYELLLTSLRSKLPKDAQKLLISAVISNAEIVGEWLNGDPLVVAGTKLNPTLRSVGFASWLDPLGRIEYVGSDDPDKQEYFVPRVIRSYPLKKKKREWKDRIFPDKGNKTVVGKEVALYLGLKLASEGPVAVFCGRKDTATGLLSMVVERFSRDLPMETPSTYSDPEEISRLSYLIRENLGMDAPATRSAELGVFSHHGNTPQGIRLAVEHAMREGLIRFVVCTSTLAQGVNLPIRYLIVTSIYQGSERIKVRDFHNLIGRVGRAGMHTEGSVLFADPKVYDKRKSRTQGWRWSQVKELLEPNNSEPCISNLLSIFDPLKSDDQKYTIKMDDLDFVRAYISDPDEILNLAQKISERHGDKNFSKDGVERQMSWKISLITAVESFLLSHWSEEGTLSKADVSSLAEGTLAYFLANKPIKKKIRKLFRLLGKNISANIVDQTQCHAYSRTLYGIRDSQAIEEWTKSNIAELAAAESVNDILDVIWPLLSTKIENRVFRKLDNPDVLPEIAQEWIQGNSFHRILVTIEKRETKLIWGKTRRNVNVDQVVDLCENGLAYDGMLLIGAVTEFAGLIGVENTEKLVMRLQKFQKQLRYGLPDRAAIALYELGFSDRDIALNLAATLSLTNESRNQVVKTLKSNSEVAQSIMQKYPAYFQERLDQLS